MTNRLYSCPRWLLSACPDLLWGRAACNNWSISNISDQQAVHALTVQPVSEQVCPRGFSHRGSISMLMKIGFLLSLSLFLLHLSHIIYYESHQRLLRLWIKSREMWRYSNEKQKRIWALSRPRHASRYHTESFVLLASINCLLLKTHKVVWGVRAHSHPALV